MYTRSVGGTAFYGSQLFVNLDADGSGVVTADEFSSGHQAALEPYSVYGHSKLLEDHATSQYIAEMERLDAIDEQQRQSKQPHDEL